MKGFVVGMLAASGLGFLKLIALAQWMPADGYGHYVALFGVGSLAGALLSFGVTERSIKAYPRWWVEGLYRQIWADAAAAIQTMGVRFSGVAVFMGLVLWWWPVGIQWGQLLGVVGVGMVTAWLAQVASMYRAVGSQKMLLRFALGRSVLVFTAALGGGLWAGWPGALLGDTLAGVSVLCMALWELKRVFNSQSGARQPLTHDAASGEGGHHQLYMANLMSSSTVMLDRAWVGVVLGVVGAGRYAVVMLLPQMAQLLVNVVVQHIGPLIIKRVHLGHATQGRLGALNVQMALVALFATGLVAVAWVAKQLPYVDGFFIKYSVSNWALCWAGVLAAGQVFAVLEFQLIARDRETDILWASATGAAWFVLLFAAVAHWGGGVEGFVAAAAASRWWQVAWLRRAYGRIPG